MESQKNESGTIFEVTLKGREKEQTFSCVLRNFSLDGVYNSDLVIREDMPLHGGLVHASKEKILEKLFDEVKIEGLCYRRKANASKDEKEKNTMLTLADALDKLDYEKLEKNLIREK